MDANKEREKNILKGTAYSLPSPSHSDSGADDNISEVKAFKILLSFSNMQLKETLYSLSFCGGRST